jgi:hypothetical protein
MRTELCTDSSFKHTSMPNEDVTAMTEEEEASLEETPLTVDISALDDEKEALCDSCVGIDIERLAARPPQVSLWVGTYLRDLGTTAMLAASRCPLCQLFASLSSRQHELDSNSPLYLRAFSARERFAGTGPTLTGFASSFLLGVVSVSNEAIEHDGKALDFPYERPNTSRMQVSLRETGYLSICNGELTQPKNGFSVRFVKSDEFDLDLARYWYNYCRSNHTKTCGNTRHRPQSLRLIDCRTRMIVQPLSWVRYAALSYVWGPSGRESAQERLTTLP